MNFRQKPFLLFSSLLMILFEVSCTKNTDSTSNCDFQHVDSLTLVKHKEIEIGIDSTMSVYPRSIQIFKQKNLSKRLIVFDDIIDQISFYDLNNLNQTKKVKILREGPKGIGEGRISGIQVVQEDSILVAVDQKIHLINSKGESFDHIDFVRNNSEVSGMPFITSEQPAHVDGKNLFVSIFPDRSSFELKNFNESVMKAFAKVNWKTKAIELVAPYPEPYRKGIYGPNFLFNFQVFNRYTDQFVFSFPAYSNLQIYDKNFSIKPKLVQAFNKNFCTIPPMEKVENEYGGYTRFFVKTPSYGGIYFDEKNKLYYRLSFSGRSQEEYMQGKTWKICSVSIFNSNFKKIGESLLGEKNISSSIIVDNGLIYCMSESKNESRIKIVVLKVEKNEK
jgi:Domain of unknown function (DUF4221)